MKNFVLLLLVSLVLLSCGNDKETIRKELNAGVKANYESNYEKALEHFNNVLAIEENNAEAFLDIANVYFNKTEYDLSMSFANKAIDADSTYGHAYKLRAEIYKKIYNESDKACENYLLAEQYGVENLYNYTRHCK